MTAARLGAASRYCFRPDFPVKRLTAFENEWKNFLGREGITEFHTSECVALNKRSEFADWDDRRMQRVVARVRQIIRKYFPKAFSISINKVDYDLVIPDEFRRVIGKYHYSWGVDAVCGFIWNWAHDRRVPMEYVFDNLDEKSQRIQKREIEIAMSHGEAMHPGDFAGITRSATGKRFPRCNVRICSHGLATSGRWRW